MRSRGHRAGIRIPVTSEAPLNRARNVWRTRDDLRPVVWATIVGCMAYYSDRQRGPKPRTSEEITPTVWKAIWGLVQTRIDNGAFGIDFPEQCSDGYGPFGTNPVLMEAGAHGDAITWPITPDDQPDPIDIFDLLEFCHGHVSEPKQGSWHSFMSHHHLSFDREEGQASFGAAVNKVFERNGIAFEIDEDGEIARTGPTGLVTVLRKAVFNTGDDDLDEMLEDARDKILSPKLKLRKEALEELWDAFERLKTLENPKDKKASVTKLLGKALPKPEMRERVEKELKELTEIGNNFMIRHTEVGKTPVEDADQIDYLFHRMFSSIRLLLKATGRGG